MEIEKNLSLDDAPPKKVWDTILDPHAMRDCVPGMESVDVINEDEYLARMRVKISFISANFTLNTRIVEKKPPFYLRAEGSGEDASVASSLTQTTEMFLAEREDGGTDLTIKVSVDMIGRLGTFGVGVMKTKASRMWDEFGINLLSRLQGESPDSKHSVPAIPAYEGNGEQGTVPGPKFETSSFVGQTPTGGSAGRVGWLSRLLGRGSTQLSPQHIHVEVRTDERHVCVDWPADRADGCTEWLRRVIGSDE